MPSGVLNLPGPDELDLDATLSSGQLFRWERDPEGIWRGWHGDSWLQLQQNNLVLHWEASSETTVRDFLRLDDLNLTAYAEVWSARDAAFAEAWALQPGVRILRQDPHECFFSFLCASVAPIARISSMLTAIAPKDAPFPSAQNLTKLSEQKLRDYGLGFRAPRVCAAAKTLSKSPQNTLISLRGQSLSEIETALTGHSGVGRKIAGCIALFSLDADEAVPVDTHIWKIALSRYTPELRGRSLTPATYQSVVDAFFTRFGEKAGWAQQILFYRRAVGDKSG
jgi:N-glycosylase/DNA lyase